MSSFHVLMCLILAYFPSDVFSDLSLLYGTLKNYPDSYYIQCAVDGRDPAVYIRTTDNSIVRRESQYLETFILEDFESPSLPANWSWTNSSLFFHEITDRRWESFPQLTNITVPKYSYLTVYVVQESEEKLLCMNSTETCSQNMSTSCPVLSKSFPKFQLLAYGAKPTPDCSEIITMTDPLSSTWILETYGHIFSNNSESVYTLEHLSYKHFPCLSVYILTCQDCAFIVKVINEKTAEIFNTSTISGTDSDTWTDMQVCYQNLPPVFTITFTTSVINQTNGGASLKYWAMDDIRMSVIDDQRILGHHLDTLEEFHSCQSIQPSVQGISIINQSIYDQKGCGEKAEKLCNSSFITCTICCKINDIDTCYSIISPEENIPYATWNPNYLYLLLLIIPVVIVAAGSYYFYRHRSSEPITESKPHEEQSLNSPSWLFEEPECSDDARSRGTQENLYLGV